MLKRRRKKQTINNIIHEVSFHKKTTLKSSFNVPQSSGAAAESNIFWTSTSSQFSDIFKKNTSTTVFFFLPFVVMSVTCIFQVKHISLGIDAAFFFSHYEDVNFKYTKCWVTHKRWKGNNSIPLRVCPQFPPAKCWVSDTHSADELFNSLVSFLWKSWARGDYYIYCLQGE